VRGTLIAGGILVALVIGFFWLLGENGFSNADLEAMKTHIKTEFEKQPGITVTEVEMIRESSKKATGFVKIRMPLVGEIMKSCTATMGQDNRYIWRCE
jgi:hypothetical protein